MREERAQALGIRTLSDLATHPALKLGLSQEFIGRADGWPGLKAAYGLPLRRRPRASTTASPTRRSRAGQIDVMDIYTTDAKIERYTLRVLEDDREVLPALRRGAALPARRAAALPGGLARAAEAGRPHRRAHDDPHERRRRAARARASRRRRRCSIPRLAASKRRAANVSRRAVRPGFLAPHAASTCCSSSFRSRRASRSACRSALLAAKMPGAAQSILGAVGVIQTIPSLALFAFLIALRRHDRHAAGADRAVPLRAAADRAQHARRPRRQSARACGRRRWRSASPRATACWRIELPLALPVDPRRHQDLGGDQRRHRDHRRLHRRRRLRRAHRLRASR